MKAGDTIILISRDDYSAALREMDTMAQKRESKLTEDELERLSELSQATQEYEEIHNPFINS